MFYRSVDRCVRRSIVAVSPMNRWVLEVRRSIVVVLPMDRWVLEVRRSIAVVSPMNRWALEVRRSISAVLPMNRWALEVRRSVAAVLPMNPKPLRLEGPSLLFYRCTDWSLFTRPFGRQILSLLFGVYKIWFDWPIDRLDI